MSTIPESVMEGILADIEEGNMLKMLSNRCLVQYWIDTDSDIAIEEMASRLWPDWTGEETGH